MRASCPGFLQILGHPNFPSAILGTDQIAGPLGGNGVWNRNEWLPSIVTSSKHLGALPGTLGTFEAVDWIPVDVLALIMLGTCEKHPLPEQYAYNGVQFGKPSDNDMICSSPTSSNNSWNRETGSVERVGRDLGAGQP